MVNVPVTIELASGAGRSIIQLASFRTDSQGTGSPKFQVPANVQGDYELRVSARTSYGLEQISHAVEVARSWRVMVTTDKPVYQPGQTIHIRGLALQKSDRHPVAGERGEFRLTDPKGNVVFQERTVTSKFGIMSTNCPLADEIIEGNYQIDCQVGDTNSSSAVEIKKYVLPKFRITTELNRTYYGSADLLQGTVDCAYFFGQPVANGKVNIDIRTTDVGPQVLTTLVQPTDRQGHASFEFRLPDQLVGRPSDNGDARLNLSITITDSAGQSQTKETSCLVTNRPLRLEVIPESGKLVRGLENRIYLLATYADGQPADNVRIAVSGLNKELTTDQMGACVLELTPQSEVVKLTLAAQDSEGRAVTQEARLECETDSNAFVLRVDNPVVEAGTTLHLMALGGGSQSVFVDFIKDGQLLLTQSIEVRNGRGMLDVDLPPELSGTVQICAIVLPNDGFPVH